MELALWFSAIAVCVGVSVVLIRYFLHSKSKRWWKTIAFLLLAAWLAAALYALSPLPDLECRKTVQSWRTGNKTVEETINEIAKGNVVNWDAAVFNRNCIVKADVNGVAYEWNYLYDSKELLANNPLAATLGFRFDSSESIRVKW